MPRLIARSAAVAALALLPVLTADAKPAKPGVRVLRNADGTELRARLVGDEFFHQYMTEDGYPIAEHDGSFYYCDFEADGSLRETRLQASDITARTPEARKFLSAIDRTGLEQRIRSRAALSPRRAALEKNFSNALMPRPVGRRAASGSADTQPPYEMGPGLFPEVHFPAYGDQKAIVILVEYSDVKFSNSYKVSAHDYFSRMLNEDGFSDLGGTGCAAEYFRENSGGHFRPQFDVYGPVTLANPQSYYGGNDAYGSDRHPEEMVTEAVRQLDPTVDFSQYDRDGDGLVDNIFIFYAGKGEASGGSANTVWPHSWNITSAGYGDFRADGVRVHTYGCSNEWEDGRPDGVGTFIHEFSHVMGLPDLYATSYTYSFTPGEWSALDYGPYNNNGMTPPLYGAFERYALGWVKPRDIDKAVTARLEPVSENVCGIIRSENDNEFFLVENRRQRGWDAYVPGHGMLVWHVDYNESIWSRNTVNNTPSHQYVDIEEADGTQSDQSRAGDCFPGTSRKTSFTASTSPAMKTWNGTALNFPITDIAETTEGDITFKVLGGRTGEIPVTTASAASDEKSDGFTAHWTPVDGYDVILSVYKAESADGNQREYLAGYKNFNAGRASEVRVTGTEPNTEYLYTVAVSDGWDRSAESASVSARTGARTLETYAVNALEASEVAHDSFAANWEALEDADEYELNVYTKEAGPGQEVSQDFTGGVANIAGGWKTSGTSSYSMASYCGVAVPSYRMGADDWFESPRFDDGVTSLTFWHRGNGATSGDRINIYAVDGDDLTLISQQEIVNAKGGVMVTISDFPANARAVRIAYSRSGGTGSVALDDVRVEHGRSYSANPVAGYVWTPVGNTLTHKVTGLVPGTDYYYTVRATSGELRSKESNEIGVHTLSGNMSVEGMEAVAGLKVAGRTVTASGGNEIIATDAAGCTVARGYGRITLPAPGLYIVIVPNTHTTLKTVVR